MTKDCTPYEAHLVEESRKGSLRHQELLYKHFYGYGLHISLRYAPGKDEAVSILNDSFLKVFSKLKGYTFEQSFRGWLRRVIINTAIDHYRRQRKHHLHADLGTAGEEAAEVSSDVISQLTVEHILQLLNELPPLYRLVFNLYELEGYSHEEIAGLLEIPASSSRVYLSRAKEQLRRRINLYFNNAYAGTIR